MRKILVLIFALLASGCATMVNGSKQRIAISTTPTGALATIKYPDTMPIGNRFADSTKSESCVTPCYLTVSRTGKEYIGTIQKEGYQDGSFLLTRKPSGWMWGNLFLGGFIGLAVDLNGGGYNLSPENVSMNLLEARR